MSLALPTYSLIRTVVNFLRESWEKSKKRWKSKQSTHKARNFELPILEPLISILYLRKYFLISVLSVIISNINLFSYTYMSRVGSMVELWTLNWKVRDSSPLDTKHFQNFFNESGIIAGKFKGDKNPGEKFYQRFYKVLLVLVEKISTWNHLKFLRSIQKYFLVHSHPPRGLLAGFPCSEVSLIIIGS